MPRLEEEYSSHDFPFTVEDWTDPNDIRVLAACRNAFMANGAWAAEVAEAGEDRKLVARWNRSWTMRRSWTGD